MPRHAVTFFLAFLLLAPTGALAQTFEGTIRQRTITLRDAAVDRLMYGDEADAGDEDVPDDETEDAFIRRMATKLFAAPMDRVLLVAREEDGEIEDVTVYMKGNRIRTDFANADGGAGFLVLDLGSGTVTMVNTTARYYVQWTQQEMQDQFRAMGLPTAADRAEAPGPDAVVRDLGRTLTIAGARCQGVEIGLPGQGVVWGWVSADYPELQRAIREIGRQAGDLFADDGDEEGQDPEDVLLERGFPMRTQRLSDAAMSPTYEVEEILAIERGTVPAGTFEVPAGYTKKTLQELWGR
jgi:hypothetical protein